MLALPRPEALQRSSRIVSVHHFITQHYGNCDPKYLALQLSHAGSAGSKRTGSGILQDSLLTAILQHPTEA